MRRTIFGAVLAVLLASASVAHAVGVRTHTDEVRWPVQDRFHELVYDRSGDIVGWTDRSDASLVADLPATYAAQTGFSGIGVWLVHGSDGQPIGFLGPHGFEKGGINEAGTELDANTRAELIDEAITSFNASMSPETTAVAD